MKSNLRNEIKAYIVRHAYKKIKANSKLSVHTYIGTGSASLVRLYARTDNFISFWRVSHGTVKWTGGLCDLGFMIANLSGNRNP